MTRPMKALVEKERACREQKRLAVGQALAGSTSGEEAAKAAPESRRRQRQRQRQRGGKGSARGEGGGRQHCRRGGKGSTGGEEQKQAALFLSATQRMAFKHQGSSMVFKSRQTPRVFEALQESSNTEGLPGSSRVVKHQGSSRLFKSHQTPKVFQALQESSNTKGLRGSSRREKGQATVAGRGNSRAPVADTAVATGVARDQTLRKLDGAGLTGTLRCHQTLKATSHHAMHVWRRSSTHLACMLANEQAGRRTLRLRPLSRHLLLRVYFYRARVGGCTGISGCSRRRAAVEAAPALVGASWFPGSIFAGLGQDLVQGHLQG